VKSISESSEGEWMCGRSTAEDILNPPDPPDQGGTWVQARAGLQAILDAIEESQADAQFSAELMEVWFQLNTWPDNQSFSMTMRDTEYWIRLRSEVTS
jgi:hypothetical protein